MNSIGLPRLTAVVLNFLAERTHLRSGRESSRVSFGQEMKKSNGANNKITTLIPFDCVEVKSEIEGIGAFQTSRKGILIHRARL